MFAQSTPHEQSHTFSALMALVPIWDTTEKAQVLPRTGEFTCGSDAACDVHVSLKGVASQHCRIFCHNGVSTVMPISDHRVWVNDLLVTSPERLRGGDALAIGPATFRIDCRDGFLARQDAGNAASGGRDSVASRAHSAAAMASASEEILRHIQDLEHRIAAAEYSATPKAVPSAIAETVVAAPMPNRLLSREHAPTNRVNTAPHESSYAVKAHEARLQDLENELDRRSEMLQQQLSMFKQRQKQFNESAAIAKAKLEETQRTSEAEAAGLLAEAQERVSKLVAAAKKKTVDLGRQSQALQRKHRGIETAYATVVEQKHALQQTSERLEADRAAAREASANAQAELENKLAEVQATHAEVNRLTEEAKANQARIKKREVELTNFDEELRHKHDELCNQAEQLEESLRNVAQQSRDQDVARAEFDAAAIQQNSELQTHRTALNEQAVALKQQDDHLLATEEAVRQQTAKLQTQSEAFTAAQQQHAADAAVQAELLQAAEEAVRQQTAELQTKSEAFTAAQQQHAAEAAVQAELQQAAEEAVRQQTAKLQTQSEAFTAAQQQHAVELEQARNELAQLQELVISERAVNDEASSRISQAEADLKHREEELAMTADQLAGTAEQLEKAGQEIATLEDAFQKSSDDYSRLEASLATADTVDEITERSTAIEKKESELARQQAELDARLATIAETQERLSEEAARIETSKLEHSVVEADWNRTATQCTTDLDVRHAELDQFAEGLAKKRADFETERQQHVAGTNSLQTLASELQIKAAKTEARQLELQAWADELDQRYEETAQRVQQLKKLTAAAVATPSAVSPSAAESHGLADALEASRRETETLTAERNELATAVQELKAAFQVVREELAGSKASDETESLLEKLAEHEHMLVKRDAELQAVQASLHNTNEQKSVLENQLRYLAESLEAEQVEVQKKRADAAAYMPADGEFDDEMELLRQVEELKAKLVSSASASSHSRTDFGNQVSGYERQICELQQQLSEAQQSMTQPDSAEGQSKLLSIIAELNERLQQQNQKIKDLVNSRDEASAMVNDTEVVGELRMLHKELDERTVVLDNREEEIRERKRKLERSEEEIENQRRQLLEARQQLELARAEIQVAMQSKNSEANHDLPESKTLPHHQNISQDVAKEDRIPAVRSEIAEPFGIKVGATKKEEVPTTIQSLLPAVDGYSQETGAAVSMSFGRTDNVLLSVPESSSDTETNVESVEDGDDFVASYMEQLLSRNREKAGGSLPRELKKSSGKPSAKVNPQPSQLQVAAPETSVQKTADTKPAAQKSFIDAYMSGEYDLDDAKSTPVTATPATPMEARKTSPRAKMDLNLLRTNMDSFRELSTRSVENALVSHAKRQDKVGITARSTILIALCLISVSVIAAALMDVFPFGLPVWLLIAATVASGAELFHKLHSLNRKVRSSSVILTKGANQDGTVSVPEARQEAAPRPTASLDMTPNVDAAVGSLPTLSGINAAAPASLGSQQETAKPEVAEDKYFEL